MSGITTTTNGAPGTPATPPPLEQKVATADIVTFHDELDEARGHINRLEAELAAATATLDAVEAAWRAVDYAWDQLQLKMWSEDPAFIDSTEMSRLRLKLRQLWQCLDDY